MMISSPQYMQGVLALVSATESQGLSFDWFGLTIRLVCCAPVVGDYLQWHALATSLKFLSSQFVEERSIFVSAVSGSKVQAQCTPTVCNGMCIQEEPKRWKTCVSMANSGSGFELGRLFVDETFSGSSKQVSGPV